MSKKRNKRLGKLIPAGLIVGWAALDYSEIPPETWQSKGKKPKPKVK